MISHLSGKILFKGSQFIILDVVGVGYRIFVSREIVKSVPAKGETVALFTHLHSREDALELYGFLSMAELEFFELLIAISGIGPKSALGILSTASLDRLKQAIAGGEITHLTKVSGIGKKTAEKIIIELRDSLHGGAEETAGYFAADADALDALVALGYTTKEAREALKKIPDDITDVEKRVATALKIVGKE